jgi:hypothetical protein
MNCVLTLPAFGQFFVMLRHFVESPWQIGIILAGPASKQCFGQSHRQTDVRPDRPTSMKYQEMIFVVSWMHDRNDMFDAASILIPGGGPRRATAGHGGTATPTLRQGRAPTPAA